MPFTTSGYQRMTYDEWLQRDIELAKKLFGEGIDTSENTALGKYIRLNCEDKRDLCEDIEQVYLSFNYKTAMGTALRRLCANVGVSVSAGEAATHSVVFHGTVGYTIAAGLGVATADKSVTFHTVNNYTIGEDGSVKAVVECDSVGEVGNVAAGEITSLVYTNANITDVTDSVVVSLGEDAESDTASRTKYKMASKARGSGTYSALLGAIYQIAGVESAYLEYNKTMTATDSLPAKSFRLSVLAPESLKQDIAETIFAKAPFTSEDVGDVKVTVTDDWNRDHDISFSWTTEKLVYVKVKFLVDSTWTASSEEDATTAIVEHINSLTNSKTVYLNDIYTALKGITGKLNILELTAGTDPKNLGTSDITVEPTEVARSNAACVTIEVTKV